MYAYQFLGLQHVAELNGWTKFISMQNYYNLIYREEEREMLPACKESGVGFLPFPLVIVEAHEVLELFHGLQSREGRWRNLAARAH